eukprot:jgi/Botrbrau1/17225/Bobra.0621s0003.1
MRGGLQRTHAVCKALVEWPLAKDARRSLYKPLRRLLLIEQLCLRRRSSFSTGRCVNDFLLHYESAVKTKQLHEDAGQRSAVQRLDKLCHELGEYTVSVQKHEVADAEYQERRKAIREALREQERANAGQRQNSGEPWWSRIQMQWAGGGQRKQDLTPAQKAIQAAHAREAKLDQMLGPAPTRPPAPQGVYIYGTVGSGKSMVMDMFYAFVTRRLERLRHRRMHFNAAMLEVNMRLHKLEKEREALDAVQLEQYAQQVAVQQLRMGTAQEGNAAPQGSPLQDPVSLKQKEAQLAKLAIRRLQSSRQGRSSAANAETLARSNAVVVSRVGRSLIRASDDGDWVADGWAASRPAPGLLCLDEMQVPDPFAAIALKGVMESLLEEGCVIVATSNRAPWDLNRQGLHEDLFEHFTQRLLQSCDVLPLSAEQDYRRLLLSTSSGGEASKGSYFFPLMPAALAALEDEWRQCTASCTAARLPNEAHALEEPQILDVLFGRKLAVRRRRGGAARFEFDEVCGEALGAADYIAIGQAFHTVFLENVPAMSIQTKDKARRFITLIDELYNARVRLVCTAECEPDLLFAGAHGQEPVVDIESLQFETSVEGGRLRRDLLADGGVAPVAATPGALSRLGGVEEKFAFSRAVSRLYEMQSPLYLQSRPRN